MPSETYRFQVWRTLWEDCVILGMGYRAYHSHMLDALTLAKKRGVELKNPKGEELQLSALTRDDLKGFLGKKSPVATGPGHRLSLPKFWVIDVFIKLQHPECAAFLDQEKLFALLLSTARSYYRNPDEAATYLNVTARSVAGIYVPTMKKGMLRSLLRESQFHERMLTIPVYIVYFDARSSAFSDNVDHCLIRKFTFPLTRDKLVSGDGIWYDVGDYERLKAKHGFGEDRVAEYFEGLGLFSPHSGLHDVSVNVLGRHSAHYTPFFARLTFRSMLAKTFEEMEEAAPSAPEWLPVETRSGGLASTKYYRLNRPRQIADIYSISFERDLERLYSSISEGRP